MLDVLCWCVAKDYSVIGVDEGELTLNAEENDAHGELNGSRRIEKSKRNYYELV